MATSITCAATECRWNKNGTCDKTDIDVSPGPQPLCVSYEPVRAQQMPAQGQIVPQGPNMAPAGGNDLLSTLLGAGAPAGPPGVIPQR